MTRFERLFAWLGGAVFVASLGYCAYVFIIRWSIPHAPDGEALVFDTLVFSMFAAHHSVFARPRVKDRLSRLVPDRMLRSVYVWTASLLFIAVCASWQPVGGSVYRHGGWLSLVHAFVQLLGVSLIARSVKTIDALELAGIRQVSLKSTTSTTPGPANGAGLHVAGPYRLVRHPLYLGWILVVFGPALMTGDRLAFAAITTAYLAIAIPWEERALGAVFGDEYLRYQRRVRWRVIPFIY
jgi:protein-S-isoprenylcysteine O-methyltransferase Ste14